MTIKYRILGIEQFVNRNGSLIYIICDPSASQVLMKLYNTREDAEAAALSIPGVGGSPFVFIIVCQTNS